MYVCTHYMPPSSTVSLPQDFLSTSSYLLEKIFALPPTVVIKEALSLLTNKAMEKTSAALNVEQVWLRVYVCVYVCMCG